MEAAAIVVWCIAAAVFYGVLHDLVTAHYCVEYFTIGHPHLFDTESPTVLAFAWGVIATWWVGAILGVMLAVAARAGRREKLRWPSLVRPVLFVLAVSAIAAAVAAMLGWMLANRAIVVLDEPLASRVPREKHVAFLTDLWAHSASYLAAFGGGLTACAWTWRARRRVLGRRVP